MIKQFVLTISLLIISATAAAGQSSVEQAVTSARDRFSDAKNRSIELERVKREANKRAADENPAPKFPEIKEDFEEIQKMNDRLVGLTGAKSPINYAAVLKVVSEINRRAVRLKLNLFSTEPEQEKAAKNEKQKVVESSEIQALSVKLDKSINSFVHSSLFQNTNLINSQDSLKAQNDLEAVIKISFSIKEKAKNYRK